MDWKKMVVLSGLAIAMIAAPQIVLAQDPSVQPAEPPLITSAQESAGPKEGDLQWAWGEVTNLDAQAQTLTLKYLDYETDQEKDLVLEVDEKTTFENIKDFSELKLKDTLSIDYLIGADSKNIATNISLEKPDEDPSLPALAPVEPAIEPAPEAPVAQPVLVEPAAEPDMAVSSEPVVEPDPVVSSEPPVVEPVPAEPVPVEPVIEPDPAASEAPVAEPGMAEPVVESTPVEAAPAEPAVVTQN